MNLDEWQEYKVIHDKVQQGKATFIAMIAQEEFLEHEISFARVKGADLVSLKNSVRNLLSGLGSLSWTQLTQAVSIIGITRSRRRLTYTCNLGHQVQRLLRSPLTIDHGQVRHL
jgi:hypothetical protein